CERCKKLAEDDLGFGDRRRHEQFHGAALALFGVDAHGEHRRDEEQHGGEEHEKARHDLAGQVHRHAHALHLRLRGLEYDGLRVVIKDERAKENENADYDVSHWRYEIMAQLLAINRVQTLHSYLRPYNSQLACD